MLDQQQSIPKWRKLLLLIPLISQLQFGYRPTTTTTTNENASNAFFFSCNAFSLVPKSSALNHKSSFLGYTFQAQTMYDNTPESTTTCCSSSSATGTKSFLYMRKQKASDRRTRRRQQSGTLDDYYDDRSSSSSIMTSSIPPVTTTKSTLTISPMENASWKHKTLVNDMRYIRQGDEIIKKVSGGRGRSRKRSNLYQSLSNYHQHFVKYLTYEYQAEEDEVLGRIRSSLDDGSPLGLETSGYALFDMYIERRGNLFADEVYRLTKAADATTIYSRNDIDSDDNEKKIIQKNTRYLPSNHKFSNNDVILLTQQPSGSGDFFFIPPAVIAASSTPSSESMITSSDPQSESADSIEARVLNTGPTYVDIVIKPGMFEAIFGVAPNDNSGNGNKLLRFRVDRFFSEIPYQRMVSALSQLSSIPENNRILPKNLDQEKNGSKPVSLGNSRKSNGLTPMVQETNLNSVDDIFREVIISSFAFGDPNSPLYKDATVCNIDELSNSISRPPMGPLSYKLASQALNYMQSNPHGIFRPFNEPQKIAIESALTRKLTMIQGPPGTGKTACASAISFGFVHQCRSKGSGNNLSSSNLSNEKVIACAFSNVGADNLAEGILKLGLKIVRIGKPSAVSENLWNHTLEAAIDRDPDAQKAVKNAAKVSAQFASMNLNKRQGSKTTYSLNEQRSMRDCATQAVKASIEASNKAATKALRDADVIITTLTGASDPRLLAACGIVQKVDDDERKRRNTSTNTNEKFSSSDGPVMAPDGLSPLSLPFVVVDEACQSVEPATLIPIISSNSCKALVLLGDPCQLPPTIRSQPAIPFLSLSLMERLASIVYLANNNAQQTKKQPDTNSLSLEMDESYLNTRTVKQAVSLVQARTRREEVFNDEKNGGRRSYRKLYVGSFLLSIQYRMHPSIAAFPSAVFYDSSLKTPKSMNDVRHFPSMMMNSVSSTDRSHSVRYINIGGKNNERQGMIPSLLSSSSSTTKYYTKKADSINFSRSNLQEERTSYWNEPEALRVITLLKDIISQDKKSDNISSIGIISPYNGQVQLIKTLMANDSELRRLLLDPTHPSYTIEVKSVDGYQGRERDVIIFSAVRSNRRNQIGFLHDWRRMNVALTRAKSALFVLGDIDTLSNADKYWEAFAKWANEANCIVMNEEVL